MPPILVDTGPLYAMADRDDDWHSRVVRLLKRSRHELVVRRVLPEAAYLLAAHLGPKAEQKLRVGNVKALIGLCARCTHDLPHGITTPQTHRVFLDSPLSGGQHVSHRGLPTTRRSTTSRDAESDVPARIACRELVLLEKLLVVLVAHVTSEVVLVVGAAGPVVDLHIGIHADLAGTGRAHLRHK